VFVVTVHATATADALRQWTFPQLGRSPAVTAAVVLSLTLHFPILAIASLAAWPGWQVGASEGYLIDCWAYRRDDPHRGESVWFRPGSGGPSGVGRVVAGPGQEVEWANGVLRIDGRPDQPSGPARVGRGPSVMQYRVPAGHFLVRLDHPDSAPRHPVEGLALVAGEEIVGRAWARYYPVRERHLL
jgi:hypothetical protein